MKPRNAAGRLLSVVASALMANVGLSSMAAEERARPSLFARTYVSYMDIDGSSSAKAGPGGAGGMMFGARQQYEFSVDVATARWSFNAGSGLAYRVKDRYTPLNLNYRFHVEGKEQFKNVAFYIGPSVGWVHRKSQFHQIQPPNGPTSSASDWNFSWGASTGFLFHISPLLAVDVGYRWATVEDNTEYGGVGLNWVRWKQSTRINTFTGGLSFRF